MRNHIAARLAGTADKGFLPKQGWLSAFQKGFGSTEQDPDKLVTMANIVEAIGEYERSQVFVETPWKHYVGGNDRAISGEAKLGALLFYRPYEEGGANCVSCHRGDFFTDEDFHVMAVPQIGRGKNDGPNGRGDIGRSDISRFLSDQYKFRTPTLLNVEVTGPWGHSGAYTSLEAMVRHMANPARALAAYDEGQLGDQIPPVQLAYRDENSALALARLEANRAAGRTHFQPVDLTDQEVGQIVAFLKTLTDPCVKDRECLKPWFFEAQTVGKEDVDGLMLRAIDHRRSPL